MIPENDSGNYVDHLVSKPTSLADIYIIIIVNMVKV
jgi:hypothetical protein